MLLYPDHTIKVVGFDEDVETLEAIRRGEMVCSIAQDPYQWGYKSIKLLTGIHRNEPANIPEDKMIYVSAQVMQNSDSAQSDKDLRNVIKINEAQIQDHLDEMVRSTVEETLNAMLDAEADQLCGAKRYERSDTRTNGRAGHYGRSFHTKAGEVELKIPKLRYAKFETAIIERYKRRESSVKEALMEMYLTGVSVRHVEDVTEALWGIKVSTGTPCAYIQSTVYLF